MEQQQQQQHARIALPSESMRCCTHVYVHTYTHGCCVPHLQEMESQRLELSPIYSEIILKHSTYDKPQQDRLFFECLYETLVRVGGACGLQACVYVRPCACAATGTHTNWGGDGVVCTQRLWPWQCTGVRDKRLMHGS